MKSAWGTAFVTMSALGIAVASSGCALTSKSEPADIHWFTPERDLPRTTAADVTSAPGTEARPELELGRVTSGAHLREKILYRDAANEIGFYEERRWTEKPEAYVRRALGRALFEAPQSQSHGFVRGAYGVAPTLDVEVVAFDEIRASKPRQARVSVRMVLHDVRGVIDEKTLSVERPIGAGAEGSALALAMAESLDEICEAVARRTMSDLAARKR